jgi:hypothetical protein
MKLGFAAILGAIFLESCATSPKIDDTSSTKIDSSTTKDFKLKKTSAKLTTGTADYKYEGQSFKSQWLQCVGKQGAPLVAFFHGNSGANNPQNFCDDWSAQVLLKNGFNVLAVNRPSFYGSNGKDDLSGPQSVEAINAGLKAASGSSPVIGFLGVDTGVIAATFTAKTWPNLKWLILGNGLYDLESVERATQNDSIKKAITAQKNKEGEAALERRSIAWDIAGLPKLIAVYHTQSNTTSPKQQASDFTAQLRTAQTKVFFDEVDGADVDLPWQAHYLIVEKALKNMK